ncbi:sensor histidine kinase [Cellulomonas sp. PhB143]|uniref:sensor histidine kinase n=1 Tax=Cellulomonas sp. PhB143 TaxID=2485186 RepID=UPI0011CE6D9B|nr:histidine kinase [Cellulomonas sp. PhB143]
MSAHPPITALEVRRLGPLRRYLAQHPGVSDVVVVAVFLLGSMQSVAAAAGAAAVLLALAAAAGACALAVRRRRPLAVAAAVGVLGCATILTGHGSSGFDLASGFATYSVAVARRPRTAWLVVGWFVLSLALPTLLADQVVPVHGSDVVPPSMPFGDITAARIANATIAVVIVLIGLASGAGVRARRQQVADIVEQSQALARESDQRAELAAAGERARIAREMHDVVAHSLTVMVALADGAKALGRSDPDLAARALDELSETGRTALTDVRRVLGVLRAPDGEAAPLAPTGAPGSLDDVVQTFRTAGLPVRLTRSGPVRELDDGVRLAAHRIVTESLTNVLRYAPLAPRVEVSLAVRAGGTELEIVVANVAGAPASDGAAAGRSTIGSGRGIAGMRERAAVHAGTVEAGPIPGGWRVRAVLPLDRA